MTVVEERRRLGRTGLMVSPIGFGGAPLGIRGYLTTEDRTDEAFQAEGIRAIQLALNSGINLFDTAPGYGKGRSETTVGEALKDRRDQAVIATKLGFGESPEGWQASLERSLARLQTDHIDILQIHGTYYPDELCERIVASGILDWADEQKRRGTIRFFGLTAENSSAGLEGLIRSSRFDVLQIAFNIVNQCHCDYARADENRLTGIIPIARSFDIGITTMRNTTSGFLQKLLSQEFPSITEADAARLSIRFALSVPEVDCALVGMTDRELVRANVELVTDRSNRLDLTDLHQRFPEGRQREE